MGPLWWSSNTSGYLKEPLPQPTNTLIYPQTPPSLLLLGTPIVTIEGSAAESGTLCEKGCRVMEREGGGGGTRGASPGRRTRRCGRGLRAERTGGSEDGDDDVEE